jgi:CRP-like cAMP-binding protein
MKFNFSDIEQALFNIGTLAVYDAGEVVCENNIQPDFIIFIKKGSILCKDINNKTKHIFSSGFYCGLNEFLNNLPFQYTIVSVSKSELLLIKREKLESYLKKEPKANLFLIKKIIEQSSYKHTNAYE